MHSHGCICRWQTSLLGWNTPEGPAPKSHRLKTAPAGPPTCQDTKGLDMHPPARRGVHPASLPLPRAHRGTTERERRAGLQRHLSWDIGKVGSCPFLKLFPGHTALPKAPQALARVASGSSLFRHGTDPFPRSPSGISDPRDTHGLLAFMQPLLKSQSNALMPL